MTTNRSSSLGVRFGTDPQDRSPRVPGHELQGPIICQPAWIKIDLRDVGRFLDRIAQKINKESHELALPRRASAIGRRKLLADARAFPCRCSASALCYGPAHSMVFAISVCYFLTLFVQAFASYPKKRPPRVGSSVSSFSLQVRSFQDSGSILFVVTEFLGTGSQVPLLLVIDAI
jgi:hypothetical protein